MAKIFLVDKPQNRGFESFRAFMLFMVEQIDIGYKVGQGMFEGVEVGI
jgi:hypothetical protein